MPKLEMLSGEKSLLGFYLSGHPLADYHGLDEAIATMVVTPDRVDLDKQQRHTVRLCGIVGGLALIGLGGFLLTRSKDGAAAKPATKQVQMTSTVA